MPETPGSLFDRAFRQIVREELEPVEGRINERMDQRFDEMDQRFDRLETMLEGVVDKDFPPIDQQPRSGGPSGVTRMAAKDR